MIETYAFLAMFTVQILAMSVLFPVWFVRHFRTQMASFPVERIAQLYPGADIGLSQKRFLNRYLLLNLGIAALGSWPWSYLFSYMQRPDWTDGPVEAWVSVYFGVQMLPLLVMAGLLAWGKRVVGDSLLEGKRKAVLQRRELFDFVPPGTVFVAVVGYILFVAFVFYIKQDPFPGFAPYRSIAGMTFVYALNAFVVYRMLYGKKLNPFETHTGRLHTIGLTVKMMVYSSIACVSFVSLNFTLVLLNLQRWEPFALSVFLVLVTLISLTGLSAPPRSPNGPELHPDAKPTR